MKMLIKESIVIKILWGIWLTLTMSYIIFGFSTLSTYITTIAMLIFIAVVFVSILPVIIDILITLICSYALVIQFFWKKARKISPYTTLGSKRDLSKEITYNLY
jgi:hypothetical protein